MSLINDYCGNKSKKEASADLDNLVERTLSDDIFATKHGGGTMQFHIMSLGLGHELYHAVIDSPIEKLKINSATTKNFVNYGIYVMRHMEMFMRSMHTRC